MGFVSASGWSSTFVLAALAGILVQACQLHASRNVKQPFTIVIFGDSLSDPGNVLKKSGVYPDPDFYYKGRFTNGPNWVDYMAGALKAKFNVNVLNYAYGGATSCKSLGVYSAYDTVLDEYNQTSVFLDQLSSGNVKLPKGGRVLMFEWSVNNDILELLYVSGSGAPSVTAALKLVQDVAVCRMQAVMRLAQTGVATDIVMPGVGPLIYLPLVPVAYRGAMQQLLDAMDMATAKAVEQLQATFDAAPADSPLFGVNVYMLGNNHAWGKGVEQFKYKDAPCLAAAGVFMKISGTNYTLCDNPQDYFLYDYVHPSSLFHKWAATESFIPTLQMMHILPAEL